MLARRAPDVRSHDALALILGNLAQACFRAGRADDARLVVMLENAARLALAAGAPANAEPVLLRLHALLAVHGTSTDRADRMLAMVAAVRACAEATRADEASRAEAARADAAISVVASDAEVAVYAHASIDEQEAQEEWDDQPLRDAVATTEVLLRTTPSEVIAIQEPVNHDAEILAAFETVVDTPVEPMIDLVDDVVDPLPASTVDIALDLADDFGLPMQADAAPAMALDFKVRSWRFHQRGGEAGRGRAVAELSHPIVAPAVRHSSAGPAAGVTVAGRHLDELKPASDQRWRATGRG